MIARAVNINGDVQGYCSINRMLSHCDIVNYPYMMSDMAERGQFARSSVRLQRQCYCETFWYSCSGL